MIVDLHVLGPPTLMLEGTVGAKGCGSITGCTGAAILRAVDRDVEANAVEAVRVTKKPGHIIGGL